MKDETRIGLIKSLEFMGVIGCKWAARPLRAPPRFPSKGLLIEGRHEKGLTCSGKLLLCERLDLKDSRAPGKRLAQRRRGQKPRGTRQNELPSLGPPIDLRLDRQDQVVSPRRISSIIIGRAPSAMKTAGWNVNLAFGAVARARCPPVLRSYATSGRACTIPSGMIT